MNWQVGSGKLSHPRLHLQNLGLKIFGLAPLPHAGFCYSLGKVPGRPGEAAENSRFAWPDPAQPARGSGSQPCDWSPRVQHLR
jgi:hypothetical protein